MASFHTGVGLCLFVLGFTRTSNRINELLHTFFSFLNHHRSEVKIEFKMNDKAFYEAPSFEIIELDGRYVLQAGSPPGGGNEDPNWNHGI